MTQILLHGRFWMPFKEGLAWVQSFFSTPVCNTQCCWSHHWVSSNKNLQLILIWSGKPLTSEHQPFIFCLPQSAHLECKWLNFPLKLTVCLLLHVTCLMLAVFGELVFLRALRFPSSGCFPCQWQGQQFAWPHNFLLSSLLHESWNKEGGGIDVGEKREPERAVLV